MSRNCARSAATSARLSTKAVSELIHITKVVATPSGQAVLSLPDTPRNGHSPRNMLNTKLLMNNVLTMMKGMDSAAMVVHRYRGGGGARLAATQPVQQQQPCTQHKESAGGQQHDHPGLETAAEDREAEQRAAAQQFAHAAEHRQPQGEADADTAGVHHAV